MVVATGKRKTSIARAVVKAGYGRVWINGVPLEIWSQELARMKVQEPLLLTGPLSRTVDIRVKVRGGGYMSQVEAVRIAIARGLLEYFGRDNVLKTIFREYDRHMLSGDPRRTESEKWGRYSARRRWQKSYR